MDILFLSFIGILSRLAPHAANMTAVGALALFSGSRYGWLKGILMTILTMIISDFVLGFHLVMWATYGSLAISVVLASYFLRKPSLVRIAGVTLLSSVIFYLVTNFAVWVIPHSIYPKTIAGLIDSYVMAIPFFRNSLIGDFFYTGVFFGGREMIFFLRKRLGTIFIF